MVLDLHVHTMRYSSCSLIHPVNLPYIASLFGLDGFAITEHEYLWEENEIEELKQETNADGLIILRGQEIRTCDEDGVKGDILVFGYPDTIECPITSSELIEQVHSRGAVAIAAHPFRSAYGLGKKVYDLDLDGIEIQSSNHYGLSSRQAVTAVKSLSLAGIGASDAHNLFHLGHFLTLFERPVTNEAELVEEIKARRCRPISYTELPLSS